MLFAYRIAGYRGVLTCVIFVTNPGVTKFCIHGEVFHLRYKLLYSTAAYVGLCFTTAPC